MNKKLKYIAFVIILILLENCSFDKATGLWDGAGDEERKIAAIEKKQKQTLNKTKVFSSKKAYSKEIISTSNIVLSKPIRNSSWEMSNLNHQNFLGNIYLPSVNNKFLKKKIGKKKFLISKTKSPPLITDTSIIFSDDTGTIFNINKAGKLNWKKNIYKKIYKKIYKNLVLSIYENHIYVADNIGLIYKINLQTGKLFWIKNHGIPLKSNIKIFNNNLYVVNQDNRILCFDVSTGSKKWDVRSISSFIKSQSFLSLAISTQGELLVLNSAGDLIKIQANNGRQIWTLNTIKSVLTAGTDFFNSSDIVIDKGEIIFAAASSVFSYNLNNGYLNWNQDIDSIITPLIDLNNVFVITTNGYLVNLEKKSGKILWSTNLLKNLRKKKQNTFFTGIIMGSGKIYAITHSGLLVVVSASKGKVERIKKVSYAAISTSPVISDGSLYILTEKPYILGFN